MVTCRYCGAPREPNDNHYGICPVLKMSLDPKTFPKLDDVKARNAEKRRGRATGRSGDNIGWRKPFRQKAKH